MWYNLGMDTEEWKEIPGFDHKYMVSTHGRVKNMDFRGTGKSRIVKQSIDRAGYPYASFRKSGSKWETQLIHRLVANVFLEKPAGAWVVNHKDGVKNNNFVDNLEWCTYQHNILHAAYQLEVVNVCPVICKETGIIYPSIGAAAIATDGTAPGIQWACTEGRSFRGTHWAKISKEDYFKVKCKYVQD